MTREEAIKVANEMYGWVKTDREREALETLVPELAESEDERVRKELIFFLKGEIPQCSIKEHADKLKEFVSYLEKQKEQKSLNISAASEWLRKHICNYINSEYNEFHKCIEYDGSIDKESLVNDFEKAMQKEDNHDGKKWIYEDDYHKDMERSFNDGKDEVLENPEKYGLQKPAEWSKEDDFKLGALITDIETRSGLTEAIKIKYVSFLKSLRPQPKREWSEEDEAHRKFILESLEDQIRFCKKNAEGAYYAKQIRTAQNWLNDLPNKFRSEKI